MASGLLDGSPQATRANASTATRAKDVSYRHVIGDSVPIFSPKPPSASRLMNPWTPIVAAILGWGSAAVLTRAVLTSGVSPLS